MSNAITLVFPYYNNPKTLEYQFSIWKNYPKEVEIIIVDDGSTIGQRAEEIIANIRPIREVKLFRILADLRWNLAQSRNLGVRMAASHWVAWIDIDHALSTESVTKLLDLPLDEGAIYAFERILHKSKERQDPHKESCLMAKRLYWDIGGFDESFSGHWSYPDRDWLWRIKRLGFVRKSCGIPLEFITLDDIPDARTPGKRKQCREEAAWDDINQWKNHNHIGVQTLKLPWKRIL